MSAFTRASLEARARLARQSVAITNHITNALIYRIFSARTRSMCLSAFMAWDNPPVSSRKNYYVGMAIVIWATGIPDVVWAVAQRWLGVGQGIAGGGRGALDARLGRLPRPGALPVRRK